MTRQSRSLDVYVHDTKAFVYAQILQDDDAVAVGVDEREALGRLERLAARLLRHDPGRYDESDIDWSLRHLQIGLPASRAGRLFEMNLNVLAISGKNKDVHEIYLPQIALRFDLQTLDDLELAVSEHLRERFPLNLRLEALLPYSTPLGSIDAGADSAHRIEQLDVRFSEKPPEEAVEAENLPTLTAVGDPLHRRLAKKDSARAFERRAEVETLLDYLAESAERSVLLTGAAGVGKSSIVYEAVSRILNGDCPDQLEDVGVWQISGGRLMAGMRFLGQWQERALKVIAEAKSEGIILFAENLIELLETAGTESHSEGIPGLLLPHLLSGDVVLITEARPEQLARAEQSHPSFLRALRKLPIEPMDAARTEAVLERVSFRLGRQFGVRLSAETRQRILELVGRFQGTAALPGPAVELAERMARTHGHRGVLPEGEERPLLQPLHALEAFASLTGLPQTLLDPDADFDRDDVRDFFENEIFAQPEATRAVSDLVTTIRAGLNAPDRPLGSFLFLGPTGVGKTQTALTLARYLFGSRDRLARFDMSEYQDGWAAGRLVGRYQGEQGELVRRIREQPFQVILLDEIEKAHSTVFDFLLQVLGEGRLTDALGQTVSMTNTVVIMTSNLGAGGPSSLGFSGKDRAREEEISHYMGAVENFFRPEFVGRINNVIPFRSLGRETAQRLVERALEEAFDREGLQRRDIRVSATDEVVEFLIRTGFDERYGARPLRRTVENFITAPLAQFLSKESGIDNLDLAFTMQEDVPRLELTD